MNEIVIILCTYENDTLEQFTEMFESLNQQTFKKFDIFVQQDGKIDNKLEDYLDYLKAIHKISYLGKRDLNKGFAYSLNELIKIIMMKEQYKYIVRMDSDDICVADRIFLQYSFMQENQNIDVCGGLIEEFNMDTNEKQIINYPENSKDILNNMYKRNSVAHVSAFFRKSYFEKVGLYDVSKLNEDYDLWIRGFENSCNFYNLQTVLVKVRTNNAFFNRRKNIKRAKEVMYLKFKLTKLFSFGLKGYIYAIAHFILFMSPGIIKQFIYKYFR